MPSESVHDKLDVKFWVFSRRKVVKTPNGTSVRVYNPRPLYAQSIVLKNTEYFKDLLAEGFAESSRCTTVWSSFPTNEEAYTDNYDYEYDSDLDSDEEDEEDAFASESIVEDSTGNEANAATGLITPPYDSPSSVSSKLPPQESADTRSRASHEADLENITSEEPCHEVIIRDASYKTWRALLYYLYKGAVKFHDPYAKSAENTIGKSALSSVPETWECAPTCSPKSMYRLAEKLGIEPLEKLAIQGIHDNLTPSNILEEAFSEFSSLYPAVLQVEVEYLCRNYDHPKVAAGWDDAVAAFSRGDTPHATAFMILMLKEKLAPKSQINYSRLRPAPTIGKSDLACYPPGIGLAFF